MNLKSTLLALFLLFSFAVQAQKEYIVYSPDNSITVNVGIDESGNAFYAINRNNGLVLEPSKLGLIREDEDFSENLSLYSASPVSVITDSYKLLTSKKKHHTYKANRQIFHLKSPSGKLLDVIFQVSDDGVAFRYYFPENSGDIKKISEEITSFNFASDAKVWLQPIVRCKNRLGKGTPLL